jgi:hypothetical protein
MAAGMAVVADRMAAVGVDSTEAAEAGLMVGAVAAFTAAVAARSTVVAEAAHIAVVGAEDTEAA